MSALRYVLRWQALPEFGENIGQSVPVLQYQVLDSAKGLVWQDVPTVDDDKEQTP